MEKETCISEKLLDRLSSGQKDRLISDKGNTSLTPEEDDMSSVLDDVAKMVPDLSLGEEPFDVNVNFPPYLNTVEPPLVDTFRKRTPPLSGHRSEVPAI